MKCCTSRYCCENPALGMLLLRMAVAALFLLPGIMKMMDPSMIIGMIQNNVGIAGDLGVAFGWAVIMTEVLGGLFVLLGKLVPVILYNLSLLGFLVILVVAMVSIHIPGGDMMTILSHVLMIASVLALKFTRPMCPMGLTGEKH